MRQAAVGLPEEEQPPGPREQAVLHPRQEDGQGLRHREDEGLRHVQVPLRSPFVNRLPAFSRNQNPAKKPK